jgi:hypothetical protein
MSSVALETNKQARTLKRIHRQAILLFRGLSAGTEIRSKETQIGWLSSRKASLSGRANGLVVEPSIDEAPGIKFEVPALS